MPLETFITVQTPAVDRNLLTTAQLRAAIGISDSSQDATLAVLGARASAAISKACRVVQGGVTPPTLRKETIIETFRRTSYWARGSWPFADSEAQRQNIILSRFPVVSVASVVVDGTTLDASEYELRPSDGVIVRLSGGQPTAWLNWKIVVTYDAGFETVPEDLALIASQMVQILWYQNNRDPNKKSEAVTGIGSHEWFGNPHAGDLVPPSLMGALDAGGFVNHLPG